jgi:hypothetical protein
MEVTMEELKEFLMRQLAEIKQELWLIKKELRDLKQGNKEVVV